MCSDLAKRCDCDSSLGSVELAFTKPGKLPKGRWHCYNMLTNKRYKRMPTTLQLLFPGHSLGGALAHLYTGALLLREPQSPAAASLEAVYTFGEPCIGGQVFVTLTEDAIRAVRGQGGVRPEDR